VGCELLGTAAESPGGAIVGRECTQIVLADSSPS
jgi:hypothetical protein